MLFLLCFTTGMVIERWLPSPYNLALQVSLDLLVTYMAIRCIRSRTTITHNMYQKTTLTHAVQQDKPFTVVTLEGRMTGKAGDWLLTGISGEHYPCDDAVFRRTYIEA